MRKFIVAAAALGISLGFMAGTASADQQCVGAGVGPWGVVACTPG